jgi:hypothetical protein
MQLEKDYIDIAIRAAGEVGAKGWQYVVEWTFTNAITGIVGHAIVIGACVWAFFRLLKWKASSSTDDTPFPASMFKGIALVALFISVTGCSFPSLVNSFRDALAPEGAAIMKALGRN